jgi:C-terminal domain 7 of the ABC-three component (ABC-3C) systems
MLGMFSANASALGYFYQARYALLLLLDSDVDSEMSLERFDDISFDQDGVPIQLLQTKHHVNSSGSLSNASTDLWKTLRVWSEAVAKRQIEPSKTVFTLITTNRAPNDSAASKLRPASVGGRDVNSALSTLCETAKKSESSVNRAAYDTFLGLPSPQQTALVTSINVLDSSPNILDTRDLILNRLKYSTRPKFLDLVFERIEGWWMNKVVVHLSNSSSEPIRNRDLQAKINDIQEQYFEDNLPIEFLQVIGPGENQLGAEQRIFIEQLRLIAVSEPRIRRAITDYYRAFEQRSKWVREELVYCGELDEYEDKLIDEWGRLHEIMKEDLPEDVTEEQMQKEGRSLFNFFETKKEIPIRPRCTEPYVMRGSMHILSNACRVGWHVEFLNRLSVLLTR